ncbi:hypothetical protein [Labilibaculum manganireducens]|nr:hypothetical protein [Labilibaculum manganireducens]
MSTKIHLSANTHRSKEIAAIHFDYEFVSLLKKNFLIVSSQTKSAGG